MSKLLAVGPLTPPITGQSLAFTRFLEGIDDSRKIVIDTNTEGKPILVKIVRNIRIIILIIIKSYFAKYDVVYFTCTRSILGSIKDIILINIVKKRNVEIINHLHGSDFYEFLNDSPKLYKKIVFNSYCKVDTSIVLANSMKEQFRDFSSMKIQVVPNFYDVQLDVQLEEKDKNKINLVYLSNIMSSKGIFELIEAFEELSKKYDNIFLKIAGEYMGDSCMDIKEVKKYFKKQISFNERITYVGKVFGEEKARLLQSSHIFILPSYYKSEAYPISILEAMACGNAIITTNHKYLPDMINEKNGDLVQPKSVKGLINGIERLLQNKKRLLSIQKYNRSEAKEKYSLERYRKSLEKIVWGKDI